MLTSKWQWPGKSFNVTNIRESCNLFENPLESVIEVVLDPAAEHISVIFVLILKPSHHQRLNTRVFIAAYNTNQWFTSPYTRVFITVYNTNQSFTSPQHSCLYHRIQDKPMVYHSLNNRFFITAYNTNQWFTRTSTLVFSSLYATQNVTLTTAELFIFIFINSSEIQLTIATIKIIQRHIHRVPKKVVYQLISITQSILNGFS